MSDSDHIDLSVSAGARDLIAQYWDDVPSHQSLVAVAQKLILNKRGHRGEPFWNDGEVFMKGILMIAKAYVVVCIAVI